MLTVSLAQECPTCLCICKALKHIASLVQAFFKDQLSGCENNGMQLPQGIDPRRGLPPELVVYADPRSEFVGETLERAYKAGGNYFEKTPLIIFVILPERGGGHVALCAVQALCPSSHVSVHTQDASKIEGPALW